MTGSCVCRETTRTARPRLVRAVLYLSLYLSIYPSTYLAVALRGRFGTLEEAARQRVLAPLRVRLVRVRGRVRFGFGFGFGFELGFRVCACALR